MSEQRIERTHPITGEAVSILLQDSTCVGDPMDHYREAELSISGKRFRGVFFRCPKGGKGPRGRTYWDDNTMVLVADIDDESVLAAIDSIIAANASHSAFEEV
jgi:hypothetical protein